MTQPEHTFALAAALQSDLKGSTEVFDLRNPVLESRFRQLHEDATSIAHQRSGEQWPKPSSRGDEVRACFHETDAAVRCAIALLHHYSPARFSADELPVMRPRIALHVGLVYRDKAPDGPAFRILSSLESNVSAGSIWATEVFAELWSEERPADSPLRMEYIGIHDLGKIGLQPIYELVHGGKSVAIVPVGRFDAVQIALGQLDEAEAIRLQAVEALGNLRDQRSREALLARACDPDEVFEVRARSLVALSKQSDPGVARRLTTEFDLALAGLPALQRLAIETIGLARDANNAGFLADLGSKSTAHLEVREAALLSLRGSPVGVYKDAVSETMIGTLDNPEVRIVQAAAVGARTLAPVQGRLRAKLINIALNGQLPIIARQAALESLLPLEESDQLLSVLAGSIDGPESLRRIILQGLGESGRGRDLGVLREVAANQLDPLRSFALVLLSQALAATPTPRPISIAVDSAHVHILRERTGWRSAQS